MIGRRRQPGGHASGPEVFQGLRTRALGVAPSSLGLFTGIGLPLVFGVVMDTTYDAGTATLVVLADGTVSLYTSTGGGVIGEGAHKQVAAAAQRCLQVAEDHLGEFAEDGSDSLPAAGGTLITLRTYSGPLSVRAPEDDLGHGRHPASPVFHAAHQVITALRLAQSRASPQEAAAGSLPDGATPLMAAAHRGDGRAVARHIDLGIPLEAKDRGGYTALIYAANAGQEEAAGILLAKGADPNTTDNQLSTPLMFAAKHDHTTVVNQLLAAGADASARSSHGLTALDFARQNGHHRTADVPIAAPGT
jgi:hypothetical protein